MSRRVAHRYAAEALSALCSRCHNNTDVPARTWAAVEPGEPEGVVCDACARRDDADGFTALCSWRRMAQPKWKSAA